MQFLPVIVVNGIYDLFVYSSGDAPDAAAYHVTGSKRGDGQATSFAWGQTQLSRERTLSVGLANCDNSSHAVFAALASMQHIPSSLQL